MTWPFIPNQLYNRRADIHGRYGGQQQGGIATPAGFPAIFIFTGHGATKIGYGDTREADGSLRYTGEGQVGDMQMIRGNQAIRDHSLNGKDLLIFEKDVSRGPVRFLGQHFCAGWETERQLDVNGHDREAIVFRLVPIERLGDEPSTGFEDDPVAPATLGELRKQALSAVAATPLTKGATRTVYERSAIVRRYVLMRAGGVCECCNAPAPFETVAGQPFLEAHHIRRVSDGGPDDPRHMAGICPNCHRRAHYGADAPAVNAEMAAYITAKEAGFGG